MTATGNPATTSAAELDERRWQDRRLASWALRAAVVLIPLLTALLVTRAYVSIFDRPTTTLSQVVYWGGAVVVCVASGVAVDRWSRRLLPLAQLYRMTLVFPGEAPSRYRMALHPGDSRLQHRLDPDAITDDAAAARHLLALIAVLADHDRTTRGHAERVQRYAELIGEQLGLVGPELDRLRWGTLIHDIGKLAVPADVLNKKDPPTDAEWQVLRSHPRAAEPYVTALSGWLGKWSLAAVHHHERWDGAGYPYGLAGREISIAGRIVAVADAYDAMTTPRRHDQPLSNGAAREELARGAGSQFDPAVVRAMLQVPVNRLRLVQGPLGWLNELAALARIPHTAATAAAGATVTAGIVAAAVLVAPAVAEPMAPDAVALERVVEQPAVDPDRPDAAPATTTTTTLPDPARATRPTTAAPTGAAPAAVSGPTGVGFALIDPATVPATLADGALTADTHVFVWREPVRVTNAPLVVGTFTDGVPFTGDSAPTTTVPTDTPVCSFLLHADRAVVSPALDVRIDFGVVPLGFALRQSDLEASHLLATPNVEHAYDGLEPGDETTVAGTEIRFVLGNDPIGRDQVRIFFAC